MADSNSGGGSGIVGVIFAGLTAGVGMAVIGAIGAATKKRKFKY